MTPETYSLKLEFPKRNALTPELLEHIEQGLEAASGRPLLLSGTAQAFCAGLDLDHVQSLAGDAMAAYLERVDRLAQRLFEYPGPTVALVEGHAIAGGCVIVQCCDWRIACDVDSVRIGVSELALGAPFPPRILRLLDHRLPHNTRRRVMLGADLYPPQQALSMGLLDEVVTDPAARAQQVLGRLASHPADAYASTKAGLVARVMELTSEDERRLREVELPLWTGEELRARIRAMLSR